VVTKELLAGSSRVALVAILDPEQHALLRSVVSGLPTSSPWREGDPSVDAITRRLRATCPKEARIAFAQFLLLDGESVALADRLSDVELQILEGRCSGGREDVASSLGMPHHIIKSHGTRIARKLGTGNTSCQVAITVRAGRIKVRQEVVDAIQHCTRADLEVLSLIAIGMCNRQIGETLFKSLDTIKCCIAGVREVARVRSRSDMAAAFTAHVQQNVMPRLRQHK
jgi:ATP/maltotriose-dependent transcriptional regulator MalT